MGYVVQTVSDRSSMKDFLDLPWQIYRDDPLWVPPVYSEVRRTLDERRNPFFALARRKLFLCYRSGAAVARTAVVINPRHEEKFGVRAAFFGFFESRNDPEAVRILFNHAAGYCRAEGAEVLEGPFNPNHYSELGLQVSNFNTPPTFFQPYNPPYYVSLLEGIGFCRTAGFVTARNGDIRGHIGKWLGKKSLPEDNHGYTIRSLDLSKLENELEMIRDVMNDAFAGNWHFVDVSREEYQFSAKFLRQITEPDLIKIVEDRGKAIAVLMCVLDCNPLLRRLQGRIGPLRYVRFVREKKRIRRLVVFAVGIRKAYRGSYASRLLFDAMCNIALRYDELETTWTSGENSSLGRLRERLGLVPHKEFAVYAMRLDALRNASPSIL